MSGRYDIEKISRDGLDVLREKITVVEEIYN